MPLLGSTQLRTSSSAASHSFILNEIPSTEGSEHVMNHPLAMLCDQFLKERTFLKNVTPSTLRWYQVAFKNYRATLGEDALRSRRRRASKRSSSGSASAVCVRSPATPTLGR